MQNDASSFRAQCATCAGSIPARILPTESRAPAISAIRGSPTTVPWDWAASRHYAHGCPTLVISNSADLACTPSHAQRLFDAVASPDKEMRTISGADHYYIERRELLPIAVTEIGTWLGRHGF